ncbi:type II secretion system major pseudopilin GspG [Deferribacterales bacterium Es71-Z0220]|jgi:general secretion pathway protein G|uniref:type II secretion system major pseudopilin GspG n=1 Tax=Deferrivibrio essentukiensis TaxID=2880922 RepID=UPI001F60FDAE|nr:type II secretion system major pseudopilin GspG [Deferrivibrio essentukiensis]MBZ4671824.1 ral secretion pathway protein [Deferribacteraceae bacterium]MCB4205576.1 type II secretion system major pseudopilin GspG [Deferrivibrio essentukiensis]
MVKKGFSLIELMVVIVILGLLATFLLPKIINRPDEARITKVKSDIKTIESALKLYKLDNGVYPTTEQGLGALISKPEIEPIPRNWKKGGYLDTNSIPKDPWGNPYIYRSPGENDRDYEIISYGADGKEGGVDNDADIKSYEIN